MDVSHDGYMEPLESDAVRALNTNCSGDNRAGAVAGECNLFTFSPGDMRLDIWIWMLD